MSHVPRCDSPIVSIIWTRSVFKKADFWMDCTLCGNAKCVHLMLYDGILVECVVLSLPEFVVSCYLFSFPICILYASKLHNGLGHRSIFCWLWTTHYFVYVGISNSSYILLLECFIGSIPSNVPFSWWWGIVGLDAHYLCARSMYVWFGWLLPYPSRVSPIVFLLP